MRHIMKNYRKIVSLMLIAMLSSSFALHGAVAVHADAETSKKPYVSLGADLSASEKKTVLDLLGITEEELDDCDVNTVTNKEEHEYLDEYLSKNIIGSRSLSSVLVTETEKGSGINVETKNISYCTKSMYINALVTAGVEDADVVVAGPTSITGTAALVGVIKAYESMTGKKVDEDVKDAALNELVTTGKLAEQLDDSEKASELMGLVKQRIVEKEPSSTDEIKDIVEDAAKELNISLTDDQISSVSSVMSKINKLDLDADTLKKQAKSLYDKFASMDIDIDSAKSFFQKIQDFFSKILDFFKKIYNKLVN